MSRRIGRYVLSEISLKRLFAALKARVVEIPHTVAWYVNPLSYRNRQKLLSYKDIHRGERCFIVANGPSLANTNLDFLQEEITFGLNRIYLSFADTSFRPTYYVAVNELVLEQFSNEIDQLQILKFLNWNRRSYYDKSVISPVYLKSKMVFTDFFQDELTKPMVFGATVTFVALQLAFYMGFHKVVLVGLDHNYVDKGVPSEPEIRTAKYDKSHFHPDYFPKGVKWQPPDLLRSEIEYELSRKMYEHAGREIVDATLDGKCQVFTKVDYLSLFPLINSNLKSEE